MFSKPMDGGGSAPDEDAQRSSSGGAAGAGITLAAHQGSLRRIHTSNSNDMLSAVSSNGSEISEKTQKVQALAHALAYPWRLGQDCCLVIGLYGRSCEELQMRRSENLRSERWLQYAMRRLANFWGV